jgi:hypothetical protein
MRLPVLAFLLVAAAAPEGVFPAHMDLYRRH